MSNALAAIVLSNVLRAAATPQGALTLYDPNIIHPVKVYGFIFHRVAFHPYLLQGILSSADPDRSLPCAHCTGKGFFMTVCGVCNPSAAGSGGPVGGAGLASFPERGRSWDRDGDRPSGGGHFGRPGNGSGAGGSVGTGSG